VISPPGDTERVVGLLTKEAGATNVVVLAGAAREPAGDVVLADVVREAASPVLDALRELRIHERGSIAIENIDVSLSRAAGAPPAPRRGCPATPSCGTRSSRRPVRRPSCPARSWR
jgi:hypothetical protein